MVAFGERGALGGLYQETATSGSVVSGAGRQQPAWSSERERGGNFNEKDKDGEDDNNNKDDKEDNNDDKVNG